MSETQNQQEVTPAHVRVEVANSKKFFLAIAREEIHEYVTSLRTQLTAESLLLAIATLTVLPLTLVLGTTILTLASSPLYRFELMAATLIALAAGTIAVVPFYNSLRIVTHYQRRAPTLGPCFHCPSHDSFPGGCLSGHRSGLRSVAHALHLLDSGILFSDVNHGDGNDRLHLDETG